MALDAKEMASLFDVDLSASLDTEESSDYETTAAESQTGQSFDKRVEDAKRTLEPEPKLEQDPETDIITQARADAKKTAPRKVMKEVEPDLSEPEGKITPTPEMIAEAEAEASEAMLGDDVDEEMEIPGDVLAEVEADIARAAAETEQILAERDGADETESEHKTEAEEAPIPEVESASAPPASDDDDNPLELSGDYLKAYRAIKKKYPQFVLYDGSRAYKGFYCFKVMVLANILREFPILDIDDMFNELSEINLRQFVSADEVTPEVVRARIDDVYRQKVRLADIMMQCYHQFFVWERELEMLKSKLWKDHELRGSHRRDGLTLEHLFDLEQYYNKLRGFMEAAKTADATLRAASDSLSRQLTCLQMREQMNTPSHPDSPAEPVTTVVATPKPRVQKSQILEPDVISDGSVITAPQAGCAAHPVDFGVAQSDDIAALG